MKYTVLLADEKEESLNLLSMCLKSSNYNVDFAKSGTEVLNKINNCKTDILLFSLELPEAGGFALIEKIRAFSNIPVILLSGSDSDCDKILGLNMGADGFISEPFNPLEVVAEIGAHLRRYYKLGGGSSETEENKRIAIGELILDNDKLALYKNGAQLPLTPMEFKIISKFMNAPGKIFTKSQLYESINGDFVESDDSTMMVHISRLREKIEDNPKRPKYIRTVRGVGYRFNGDFE